MENLVACLLLITITIICCIIFGLWAIDFIQKLCNTAQEYYQKLIELIKKDMEKIRGGLNDFKPHLEVLLVKPNT